MPSKKKLIVTGAAGLALITAGALPAFAAGGHPGLYPSRPGVQMGYVINKTNGRVVFGTISSLEDGSLVLTPKTRPGATSTPLALTVDTTASTTIMKDGQQAALADLAAGETAIVSGTRTSDTALEASRILVRTKAKAFGWMRHK